MKKIKTTIDKCLLCKKNTKDAFWKYIWKGKEGYCCEPCGKKIHKLGYAVCDLVTTELMDRGLEVRDYKEKCGFFWLTCDAEKTDQKRFAEKLFKRYKKKYKDLSFIFRCW